MSLILAFSETDITTKFFFSSIIGVGVSAFFIFLLFWLTNQKAMFNGPKQLINYFKEIYYQKTCRQNFYQFNKRISSQYLKSKMK